jgi:hippurate hydrolase
MRLNKEIVERTSYLQDLRHLMHSNPETAFEEVATSRLIADALGSAGIEVHCGLAKTGVVGTLRGRGQSSRAIGLRADIDALNITEKTSLEYASRVPGKMHACGHDGHTVMLLGAALHLAKFRNFDGVVQFIFQPAEENEGGGRVMIEDGLFEKFPVDAIYALHNWPGLPVGEAAVRAGPMMASYDIFEIIVTGRGGHAAMPHLTIDPIATASHLVQALQAIVSRNTSPLDSVVISVTQIFAGDTWNVIPEEATLRGTVRTLRPEIQDAVEAHIHRVVSMTAAATGASATVRYERRYPATINNRTEAEIAANALAKVVGEDRVHLNLPPSMGAEDFAFMLNQVHGAYLFLGNGPLEDGRTLHSPQYDFNDELIPIGATFWSNLVETALAPRQTV